MSTNIYDKIREENIKKYGTDIHRYGPTLLANRYSDKTHFIYELIQNAEDACRRAKNAGEIGKFILQFQLSPHKLEVRHNGIPFDENDLIGICGLVEGTKSEDPSQIGKFGIGFKSVYAYTKTPKIYSGAKTFCIKNYVQPYSIKQREDVKDGETLFEIPFDNNEITKEIAYSDIQKRLKKLNIRTLLFLETLEEISWVIGSSNGTYSRNSQQNKDFIWITLSYKDNFGTKDTENWLILEREIDKKEQIKVQIAYLIEQKDHNKEKKMKIIPARNTELFAFLQTEKTTHLKFLINGQYKATPSRDNIYVNESNSKLIEETALLVAESLSKIKGTGLLDVNFLNTLPIESDYLLEENMIFEPIYKSVHDKLLSDESLLPAYNGEYISAQKALIADGKALRDLLSPEQLDLLFNRTTWLDEDITESKNKELRRYLMEELKIPEINPKRFAQHFSEEFIKEQSDDWVKSFYQFLLEQEALWRKKPYPWETEGILRSKPIIRLENGSHTRPFDSEGKPLVYLPSMWKTDYPTVKKSLVEDKIVKEFLTKLDLKDVDITDYLDSEILSKYTQDEVKVTSEENVDDVKLIFGYLKDLKDDYKHKLLEKLKETPFLIAVNYEDQKEEYKKPSEIYLGRKYTGNNDLDIYFEKNGNAWFLSERYINAIDTIDISFLRQMGCKSKIHVIYREANWNGHVTIYDFHGWHERGLYGFDPSCEIEGLEYALGHINLERAKIIWNIVKEHSKMISGTVECATHQDYSNSTKEEKFSKMGELLIKYQWLPDKGRSCHKPSEILFSDLHEELDKENLEAKFLEKKLKFKTAVEQQLLEQLPQEKRRRYERVDMLYQIMPEDKVNEILDSLIEQYGETEKIRGGETPVQIRKEFEDSLVTTPKKEKDGTGVGYWEGFTLEEEESIRKEFGEEFPKRLERVHIIQEPKIVKDSKIIDSIDPKEFLLSQYSGHCQICNTRLDLGGGKKPYFETFRIFETQSKNPWTNMEFNVLCLCPNCHALAKHGGKNFENVAEIAKNFSRGEVAPEEVNERSGDYYIIPIEVAGEEREIFYTQSHMAKLAAFIEQTEERDELKLPRKEISNERTEKSGPDTDLEDPLQLIITAFMKVKGDRDWINLADLGNSLKQLDSGFNPKTYGYNKLNQMIRDYPDVFEIKIRNETGPSPVYIRKK